jgi:hypothetical protein
MPNVERKSLASESPCRHRKILTGRPREPEMIRENVHSRSGEGKRQKRIKSEHTCNQLCPTLFGHPARGCLTEPGFPCATSQRIPCTGHFTQKLTARAPNLAYGATWLLEVMDDSSEPRKVKLTDKHLTDQRGFRRLMLSQRICAMPPVKRPAFEAFVASIHRAAKDTPIMMPFESTAAGQFKNYLCEFVELKHTEDPADVRVGMVYHCAKDQEVRFRLADLTQWLDVRKRWTVWDRRVILLAITQTYQGRQTRLSDPGRSSGYAIRFSVLGMTAAPERQTEGAGEVL